jgi:hypothetical protein
MLTATVSVAMILSLVGCKKTTNNTTVIKDSIYYSPWVTLAMTPSNGDSLYYQDFTASKITPSVISTGSVISYIGVPSQPSAGDTTITDLIYWNAVQILSPEAIEVDASGYLNDLSGLLYRYVVIPGSVLTTTSLHNFTQQQLQRMSFTDLQKAANTPLKQTSGNTFTP